MRTFLDSTCARCGARESFQGMSTAEAHAAAESHVCADGVRTPSRMLTVRVVPGPGERTKLPEERNLNYRF